MDLDIFLAAACDLLAMESTADRPDDLRRAVDFVVDFVGPGFSVERFESAGKPSALIYFGAKRPPFDVILNGHLDVVPAPADQFRPRREGDRLYARGAQDMKVTALVQALAFRELAAKVPYSLGLQLVADEEAGGRNGTFHQLQQGVVSRFVIIGETSALRITTESKGIAQIRLRAVGSSAHGAYPWLGDNALIKLIRTVEAILSAFPVPASEAWRTTVNVARIQTAGNSVNQVPSQAEAWLDVRFPAADPRFGDKDADEVGAFFQSFCATGVTPVVDHVEPPHHADENSDDLARLRAAAQAQGYSGDFLRKHGTGDARYYGMQGINAVSFGTGGANQHGPDEYVDLATIGPYYRALCDFLGGTLPTG